MGHGRVRKRDVDRHQRTRVGLAKVSQGQGSAQAEGGGGWAVLDEQGGVLQVLQDRVRVREEHEGVQGRLRDLYRASNLLS